MKLSTIILALRAGETYFNQNIGGAIDLARVEENTLTAEVAFVVPLGEDALANDGDVSVNQVIRERFAVVCIIKNDSSSKEKAGLLAYDSLDNVRADLLRVLVNLDLGYDSTIEYQGGKLLDVNRAWLWWQYEFIFNSRISADGAGIATVEYRDVDEREDPLQLPELNQIYTDIILSPSNDLPYDGQLPASSFISVNASTIVDTDDDPNPGAFDSGFAKAFRVIMENIIRR